MISFNYFSADELDAFLREDRNLGNPRTVADLLGGTVPDT